MTTQPSVDSFGKRSASEQTCLLQELWDEVVEEAIRTPLSESHRRFLDERLQQHRQNPDDVEPWEGACLGVRKRRMAAAGLLAVRLGVSRTRLRSKRKSLA